jgi:hypothetical protein
MIPEKLEPRLNRVEQQLDQLDRAFTRLIQLYVRLERDIEEIKKRGTG